MVVMVRFCLAIVLFLLCGIIVVTPALARHGRVLGDATDSSNVDVAVNQGPGLLLPTSPLYFLDLWRDNLMLLLASFQGEVKAKLHLTIAGERITEVKLMLEGKDVDPQGLDTALANIAGNVEGAADVLLALKNSGQNVEKLALELDQIIDGQQASLRIIAKVEDDKIKLKIKAVEKDVDESEVEIEDELPDDELENEIEDELEEDLEDELEEAEDAAQEALELAEELEKEASKAAIKNLKRLQKKLEEASIEQRERARELLKEEQEEQDQLHEVRTEIRRKTEEAARRVGEAGEASLQLKELRIETENEDSEDSGSGSSGSDDEDDDGDEESSGSSGSGSSGSGSDND